MINIGILLEPKNRAAL
uniref:Uncharacterized protein n=1 Tax=Lepeophtheirus salmonis TaxID=72036 RepID=A0A0K2VI52_LEPSM